MYHCTVRGLGYHWVRGHEDRGWEAICGILKGISKNQWKYIKICTTGVQKALKMPNHTQLEWQVGCWMCGLTANGWPFLLAQIW